ncbi:MAG: HAMP domain-containing sensor histidine kinase [Myxococcota bacterium]
MNTPLSRRLLLGVALASVTAGVLSVVGLRTVRPLIQVHAIEAQVGGIDHSVCVGAPSSWGWSSGGMSLFAYDRSGRSHNPGAPALEPDLLRRARAGERATFEERRGHLVAVVPFAPDGPCAMIRSTSRNTDEATSRWFLSAFVGATLLGMILSVWGTFWLVVRPLRARIDALATASRDVGSASFKPEPASPDALGHIAAVLTQSHERIATSQRALEARNQALERHLAAIAHDLRTPLTSMHLALEALAAESQGHVRLEARRALADAVYLSSMVENLHQATRLRHEVDVTSGRVDLGDLVRRIERRLGIVGRHAEIEVASHTPDRDVWVACTPALAERALSNLVQNAIEHNDGPGHVAITLSLRDAARRFVLVVADDGPGMPPEQLATLQHETFLTEDTRARGPGLGTLIATEIARRAGWQLSYELLEPNGLQVRIEGSVADSPPG